MIKHDENAHKQYIQLHLKDTNETVKYYLDSDFITYRRFIKDKSIILFFKYVIALILLSAVAYFVTSHSEPNISIVRIKK